MADPSRRSAAAGDMARARDEARPPRRIPAHRCGLTDGASIWLPRVLESAADEEEETTVATYRLLAIEQAARAARGTPTCVATDWLTRDLYLLAEAVAVDRALARDFAGLVADLRAARAAALRERPSLERLTAPERTVERLFREVLAADPSSAPAAIPLSPTPDHSLRWARAMATRLRRAVAGGYRGAAIVEIWGQVKTSPALPRANSNAAGQDEAPPAGSVRSVSLRRRPRVREAAADEDDDTPGTWMIRPDEPMEGAEDPMGLQRPADRDEDADAAGLTDSVSELPEARIVRTPGTPREVFDSDTTAAIPAPDHAHRGSIDAGIVYPEWDYRLGAYGARGAVVLSPARRRGSRR
jgi:nitric oxide reductase NorD protein